MAKTQQYQPGQDSIDASHVQTHGSTHTFTWRYWPADGGKPKKRTITRSVRLPNGKMRPKSDLIAVARNQLAKMKAIEAADDDLTGSSWGLTDSLSEYLDQVTLPAIERGQNKHGDPLSAGSQRVYRGHAKLLRGECGNDDHDHSTTAITAGSGTIGRALKFRSAEMCIQDIARTHGADTADGCRTVLEKYLYGQLRRDGLVDRSPLAGMPIALGNFKAQSRPTNPAVPAKDYYTVLEYLLGMDPEAAIPPKRMQKRLIPSFYAKRRNAIDLTLLQMTTGLRIGECRSLEPAEVLDNAAGGLNVYIPAAKAKNNEERTVTVLDDRVADRIRQRRDSARKGSYVLGAPADDRKRWDDSNSAKAIAALYRELAEATGVDVLDVDFRSHGWRGTLNMLHYDLPDHIRAGWFGHTSAVNRRNYTRANVDHSEIVTAHSVGRERHLKSVGR